MEGPYKYFFLVLAIIILPYNAFSQSDWDLQKILMAKSDSIDIVKSIYGEKHPSYAQFLNDLAECEGNVGHYDAAKGYVEEALKIIIELNGEESIEYAKLTSSLAWCESNLGNFHEAIKLERKALVVYEREIGINNSIYAKSLSNLAWSESSMGNYQQAIKLESAALEIRKQIFGNEHPFTATSYSNLAEYEINLGNFTEGEKLELQAIDIRKKLLGVQHQDYAKSLSILAWCESSMGDYTNARNHEAEALSIREYIYGKEHPIYANSLSNLAWIEQYLGNIQKAKELDLQALEIRYKSLGEIHPYCGKSLNSLAEYENQLGNDVAAVDYSQKALYVYEQLYGHNHPDYAVSLSNLAYFESRINDYVNAIAHEKEALEINKNIFGENHFSCANSLSNLAGYNSSSQNFEEAIELEIKALDIRKKTYGDKHPVFANSLSNLAWYYACMNDYVNAEKYEKNANSIYYEIYGENHPAFEESLNRLSLYEFYIEDYDCAQRTRIKDFEVSRNLLQQNFATMTPNEQRLYWQKKSFAMTTLIPYYAWMFETDDMCECAYDAALLSKGLLLHAEQELKQVITNSNDSSLINLYSKLIHNIENYNKQSSLTIHERTVNVDSLQSLIVNQQKLLVNKSKDYGDFTSFMYSNWKEVQSNLGDKDLAIEFIDFAINGIGNQYYALVVSKTSAHPIFVNLFNKKDIDLSDHDRLYNNSQLYELIWNPIENGVATKHISNVYFAPTGILHKIAIESARTVDNILVSSKYNCYRLSSTREITSKKRSNILSSVSLYGGIDYNASLEDVNYNDVAMQYSSNRGMRKFEVFESDTLNNEKSLRAGVRYLPGTKTEVDSISSLISSNQGILKQVYTGIQASEESFLNLDGQPIDLLHIATHGFYWTESDVNTSATKLELKFLVRADDKPTEDKAMTRSGLLFSGANETLKGLTENKEMSDGVLTASELSTIDLRNLDLAVLSACETGLGDIGSEGVFGLQRGFKKAGVKSLLMSLWKVDDDATRLLMVEFYKSFLNGKSKIDSLKTAQKIVRQTKGFEDPIYWAGFILLDALN